MIGYNREQLQTVPRVKREKRKEIPKYSKNNENVTCLRIIRK
jgi:hypothetical protein